MRRLFLLSVVPLLACSDSSGPVFGEPVSTSDPDRGLVAFRESCAGCHVGGDGFDLALFGFSDFDIVRRGVAHVDSATARDIAAHVGTFAVAPIPRATRLFQPEERLVASDEVMWIELFGSSDWPSDLSPETLAAMDFRDIPIPLGLPTWSNELDKTDWLPDRPLPEAVLEANEGALQAALDAYLRAPDIPSLEAVLDTFREVTEDRTVTPTQGRLCGGIAGAHPASRACFEARRWMSSLAAIHFLRFGTPNVVPTTVVRTWWETGEVAVTEYFIKDGRPGLTRTTIAAQWLYLGFLFGPDEFQERNGYLGRFLRQLSFPRLATLALLRRMVGSGPAQEGHFQRYEDAQSAAFGAPDALAIDVVEFTFEYLSTVPVPTDPTERGFSVAGIRWVYDDLVTTRGLDPNSERARELRDLRDRLLSRLES